MASTARAERTRRSSDKKPIDILRTCDIKGLSVTSKRGSIVDAENAGILLPKSEFSVAPVFQMKNADPVEYYTIIMVDPDAPGHKEGQFYLHMIKANIPGSSLVAGKSGGDELLGYRKPTPPKGTGAHRYISLVFKQDEGNYLTAELPSERAHFALGSWLRGKALFGPVAANEFTAEY